MASLPPSQFKSTTVPNSQQPNLLPFKTTPLPCSCNTREDPDHHQSRRYAQSTSPCPHPTSQAATALPCAVISQPPSLPSLELPCRQLR
ncbi:hypothetical protein M0R45_008674 [Rubus argutus]|uniref:Uncharacterized protein n=1 Tax=Rubus argutus TaxID=59490 RepID=A0AAW1Y1H5_RUBAR